MKIWIDGKEGVITKTRKDGRVDCKMLDGSTWHGISPDRLRHSAPEGREETSIEFPHSK